MKLYVSQFTTLYAFQAELDDPSVKDLGMEGLGSPQFYAIEAALTDAYVERVKTAAVEELFDDDPLLDEERLARIVRGGNWRTAGWVESPHGRPHQCWELIVDETDKEALVCIVIQEYSCEA
jgi:hypothetical protein